jgi:ATP-dependent RNA helicase SUPV3L1/SUV3
VDYLVATDAIGMGLNLDIDHVAFTGLRKFDGQGPRPLRPDEIAQVAGRAGRHVKDGSFGPTDELGDFDPRLVESLEAHRFPPLPALYWRNSDLCFDYATALLQSLELRAPRPELQRPRPADDHRAFAALLGDPEVALRLRGPDDVRRLWEVAQVPDFQSVLTEAHTRLLQEIFLHLSGSTGRLPEDWVEPQVRRLDHTQGEVDALLHRIAAIRTCFWQDRTRGIEDRLSDALHERLTAQFVDRRATVIARQDPHALLVEVDDDGFVLVQGLAAGRLRGFVFEPEPSLREQARALLAAANRGLRAAMPDRVRACEEAPDATLSLSHEGQILWGGAAVGRLQPGESVLTPQVEVLPSDLLAAPQREALRKRLLAFVEATVRRTLLPLFRLREAPFSGAARGLGFAIVEGLGTVPRRAVAEQVRAISGGERQKLSRFGVTFAREALFLPALLRPEAVRLRAALAATRLGRPSGPWPDGGASLPATPSHAAAFYSACAYLAAGPRLVRVDVLASFAAGLERAAAGGPFRIDPGSAAVLGCTPEEVQGVLRALGYVERGGGFFVAGTGAGRWRGRGQDRRQA